MPKYIATIRHHSISRAREIKIKASLTYAKRAATREFGQEQLDYEIVIYGDAGCISPEIVSTRRVSARKWQDRI